MDTIFMNSENSKTSKPHVLILKLTNKLEIKQIVYSLYQSTEITKKVYNNIIKSI